MVFRVIIMLGTLSLLTNHAPEEWKSRLTELCVESTVVVSGTVEKVIEAKPLGNADFEIITLRIDTVYKGKPVVGHVIDIDGMPHNAEQGFLPIIVQTFQPENRSVPHFAVGGRYILFLKEIPGYRLYAQVASDLYYGEHVYTDEVDELVRISVKEQQDIMINDQDLNNHQQENQYR